MRRASPGTGGTRSRGRNHGTTIQRGCKRAGMPSLGSIYVVSRICRNHKRRDLNPLLFRLPFSTPLAVGVPSWAMLALEAGMTLFLSSAGFPRKSARAWLRSPMGRMVASACCRPAGVRGVRRGEAGQILLMSALMLPILLGFTALAIDAGYAFELRKRVQVAADAGALAGAHAIDYNSAVGFTELETIARNATAQNGFTNGTNGVVV